jgi:hypothetical protein
MRKTDEAKATERRERTHSGDIHRFPGIGHSNRAVQVFRNGERSDFSLLGCNQFTDNHLSMSGHFSSRYSRSFNRSWTFAQLTRKKSTPSFSFSLSSLSVMVQFVSRALTRSSIVCRINTRINFSLVPFSQLQIYPNILKKSFV